MLTNKAIIVLQQNGGVTPLDASIPQPVQALIRDVIDQIAVTFEDIKTSLQAAGHYDVVHLLTDNSCTRATLLNALVEETKKGRVIDLVVLGHGKPESLMLKKAPHLTGGANSTIRSLLPDAKKKGVSTINLRMVYMCNCYSSTLNDDWLAIGAKVSIGASMVNWMPEPTTTFFIQNWIVGQKAKDAAKNAYDTAVSFYLPIFPPTPKVTYTTLEIPYPCPTLANPLRICRKKVQVPDGVEFVPHTNVKQSQLLIRGNGDISF